jgi:hypothetical protein
LDPFCFSGGVAIHAEGREGRSGTTAERANKVGVRRPETLPVGLLFANQQSDNLAGRTYPVSRETGLDRWAALVWAKSFGFGSTAQPVRPSPNPSTLPQTITGRTIQSNRMLL